MSLVSGPCSLNEEVRFWLLLFAPSMRQTIPRSIFVVSLSLSKCKHLVSELSFVCFLGEANFPLL